MSKIKTIFSIFIFLFSASLVAQKDYDPDRTYSVAQLQEDFSVLYQAFYREHPGWAVYHSEDSMIAWFAETEEKIDRPMTELEFRKILYPLNQKIGCGHTRINKPQSYYKYSKKLKKAETVHYYLPFQIRKIDQQLLVLYNHLEDSTLLPPGTEILEIDGRSATQIIEELQSAFPSDGYNTTHRELVLNYNFKATYRSYYGEQKEYDLKIRLPDASFTSIRVPAKAFTAKAFNEDYSNRMKKHQSQDSVILKKKGYQLSVLKDQENTAILKIKHFDGKRGKRFYKKAFQYIEEQKFPLLVIDLRDNGGGNGKEALNLVSYFRNDEVGLFGKKNSKKPAVDKHLNAKFGRKILFPIFMRGSYKLYRDSTHSYMGFYQKPQKKNQFKGKSMILSNGNTFSSSVIVGAYIKDGQPNTTFIGHESGGGAVSTNAFQMPRLILPNTKISLVYPFYRIVFDIKAEEQGRGLIPDYQVEYSLEDFLEGNDLEMEIVKEIAKQQIP